MRKILITFILASLSSSSYGDYFDVDEIVFSQQMMPYVLKYRREKKLAENIRLLRAFLKKYQPGTQAKLFLITEYMRVGKFKEAGALGDIAIEELAKIGKADWMNLLGTGMAFANIRDAVRSYQMAGEKEKSDKLLKRLKEVAISSGHDEGAAILKKRNIKLFKVDDSELEITQKEIEILNSKFKIEDNYLIIASQFGKKDSVVFLINHGVDVNSKLDNSNATALHFAAINGHLEIAELLIKNKADINIEVKRASALNIAIMRGHTKMAKLLIEKGSDLNSQDILGNTPLHNAIIKNNTQIVELLIKNKASKEIKNKKGKTPSDLLKTDSKKITD